jgi:putative transposase
MLVELMQEIFDAADVNYGVPRMAKALRDGGQVVNRKRVHRLMRANGMVGRFCRRRVQTTIHGPGGYRIPDLLSRAFAAGRPDRAWCEDITYVQTGEGWLYVASVLDVGSRKLLGYSMTDHMRTELVTSALTMVILGRGRDVAGVIAHWLSPSNTLRSTT